MGTYLCNKMFNFRKETQLGKRPFSREITDRFVLLYVIREANRVGSSFGFSKLQKLVFLVEQSLNRNRINGLSFGFNKRRFGPYSSELSEAIMGLTEERIVSEKGGIALARRGNHILEDFEEVLKENEEITNLIQEILHKHAPKSLIELKDYVIDVEINPPTLEGVIRFEDVPAGSRLPLIPSIESKKFFKMDSSTVETLEIYFDLKFYRTVMEAMREVKSTGSQPYR